MTNEPPEEPVHEFFGLSYCNFQVVHRSIAQSMPVDWQRRFVALMEEANAEVGKHGIEVADSYELVAKKLIDEDDEGQPVYETIDDPVPHYNRGRARLWRSED